MNKKQEESPMMVQKPDATKIMCKDCAFKDKTTITLNKKKIPVGITKGNCEIFVYPDTKPSDVLFQNAECEYYQKE